jgi:2-oxoglutarate dehydrogenase E2 component (dihydrolipoamide succinyltransferase)
VGEPEPVDRVRPAAQPAASRVPAHAARRGAFRARNDRLKLDDIQDGTFSITNAGVFGAINSSPVINVPEVAILGVHKIFDRPVVKDGEIVIRPMMNASIGFDHRVIDGELAVKFLRRVCELLERPEMLWFYA